MITSQAYQKGIRRWKVVDKKRIMCYFEKK